MKIERSLKNKKWNAHIELPGIIEKNDDIFKSISIYHFGDIVTDNNRFITIPSDVEAYIKVVEAYDLDSPEFPLVDMEIIHVLGTNSFDRVEYDVQILTSEYYDSRDGIDRFHAIRNTKSLISVYDELLKSKGFKVDKFKTGNENRFNYFMNELMKMPILLNRFCDADLQNLPDGILI